MRFNIVRGFLVGLALTAIALLAYQFARGVWVLLEMIPTDVIVGGLGLMWCIAIVAYTRWMIGKLRKPRQRVDTGLVRMRGAALRAEHTEYRKVLDAQAETDKAMERMERSVHEWSTRGDTPGSLAGSVIGLEAIDEYLEGDM